MDIAFNFNTLGLEGLGPTLTSLIRNCSNTKELTFWFLCSGVSSSDKINIEKLLAHEAFKGKINFINFNAKKTFGHLRPLHGDWSAYGRLLIPSKINRDAVLYLDCDLIILIDVLELSNFDFSDKIFAAVYGSQVEHVLEKDFLMNKLGWRSDIGYFNSGIMLFNNRKWHEEGYENKVKELCNDYPSYFLSADQTILNAICKGDFKYIDDKFNMEWPPGLKSPKQNNNAILHLVGSPKPWDYFGKWIHYGHGIWRNYNTSFWKKCYGSFSFEKLRRTYNIRFSLIKCIVNRAKNNN